VIYLDGNSLGPTVTGLATRLGDVVGREWGQGLIRAWNPLPDGHGDWISLARRVGDRIAPVIGVGAGEVHVGDSTSVTLFKTFVAAARMRPDRRVILMERSTFPTDAHVAAGVAELLGLELRLTDDPVADLDRDVALLALTHVDFRTGASFDMAALTAAAHECGALVQWDLCHSAGALEIELGEADFAVGCTYKYLNGGPGSPAFVWAHPRHLEAIRQPIPGWMGHRAPFSMALAHEPAAGIARFGSGTPPVLALSALDHALGAFDGVAMADVRRVSLSLTALFMDLLAALDVDVLTPRDETRGSQVSFRHPHAYGIVQALIARGVIGDYRDDGERDGIARFGFAPLYVRHTDVWDAVAQLRLVMQQEEYADPAYSSRNAVT
jgi:kynureninase